VARFWQRRTVERWAEAVDPVVSEHGYVPLASPVEGSIRHRFSVAEGREAYATIMAARTERIAEFEQLMGVVQVDLGSEKWLSEMEAWCCPTRRMRMVATRWVGM
jgi:hypothetical protein